MNSRVSQRGFTLIEVVIAMALASVVVLMGTSALSTVSTYQNRTSIVAQRAATLDSAAAFLRYQLARQRGLLLASAQVLEFQAPVAEADSALGVPGKATFQCRAATSGQFDLLFWAVPLVQQAPSSSRFVPAKLPAPGVPDSALVLAEGLAVCAFEYGLQAKAPTGAGLWQGEWTALSQQPSLLRIQLGYKAGAQPRMVVVLAAPRV